MTASRPDAEITARKHLGRSLCRLDVPLTYPGPDKLPAPCRQARDVGPWLGTGSRPAVKSGGNPDILVTITAPAQGYSGDLGLLCSTTVKRAFSGVVRCRAMDGRGRVLDR